MFPTLESKADILKMLEELSETRKEILNRCKSLGGEVLKDPVYPHTWTILENLSHLAWAEEFMLGWIQKRPNPLPKEEWPKKSPLDLEQISIALDEAHAAVLAFVKRNDEGVLKEKCEYVPHRGSQTVGGLLFHVVEHEIGHRTFVLHKLKKLEEAKNK